MTSTVQNMRYLILLCRLLSVIILSNCRNNSSEYLLPTGVVPCHYNIKLTTKIDTFKEEDPESFSFDGIVEISLRAVEPDLNQIVVNGKNITIKNSALRIPGTKNLIPLVDPRPQPDNFQKITFQLANESLIVNKEYSLIILYHGYNNDDLAGFYRSNYKVDNQTRWLLVTHFEPVGARRAFPCFDEPQYKATFKIDVSMSKKLRSYHALSNMPLEEGPHTDPRNESNKLFQFKRSKYPMSTYLIAILVSDFKSTKPAEYVSDYRNETGKKMLRLFGQEKFIKSHDGEIGRQIGPKILEYLTKKLGIGYPFSKMDMTGIPQFLNGAMENIGLITYREEILFTPFNTASINEIIRCVKIIAHESAHQWFGDLVTTHWWSDTWLNEGFANYFENFSPDEIDDDLLKPTTWRSSEFYVVEEMQNSAMITDSSRKARTMSYKVFDPTKFEKLFDDISYSRGGSVIRMFSHILGQDVFYRGLQIYLDDRQLHTATPKDLADALQKSADKADPPVDLNGKTVDDILTPWRVQAGYPVVTVIKTDNGYQLKQRRFHNSAGNESGSWDIPISFGTSNNLRFSTAPKVWMSSDGAQVQLNINTTADWFIVNINQSGYYRVNYPPDNWKSLINLLKNKKTYQNLPVLNRAQLIDDSFKLSLSTQDEYVPPTLPFELAQYLIHETDIIPLKSYYNQVAIMASRLVHKNGTSQRYKIYNSKLMAKKYIIQSKISAHDESIYDRLFKSEIVKYSCDFDVKECVEMAKSMFKMEFSAHKPRAFAIDPDIKETVYCTAIRHGGQKEWDSLFQKYIKPSQLSERRGIIQGLGSSLDPSIINKLLEMTIDDKSELVSHDRVKIFQSIYKRNAENIEPALQFLSNNTLKIIKMYGVSLTRRMLNDIPKYLSDKKHIKIMENLTVIIKKQSDKDVKTLLQAGQMAVSTVKENSKSNTNKISEIEKWLENNVKL